VQKIYNNRCRSHVWLASPHFWVFANFTRAEKSIENHESDTHTIMWRKMSYWSSMNYKLMSPPLFHRVCCAKKSLNCGKMFSVRISVYFILNRIFQPLIASKKSFSRKQIFFSFDCFNAHCLFIIWECASLSFFPDDIFSLASAFWNSIVDLEMIVHCSLGLLQAFPHLDSDSLSICMRGRLF
jgi:hypothetical protein